VVRYHDRARSGFDARPRIITSNNSLHDQRQLGPATQPLQVRKQEARIDTSAGRRASKPGAAGLAAAGMAPGGRDRGRVGRAPEAAAEGRGVDGHHQPAVAGDLGPADQLLRPLPVPGDIELEPARRTGREGGKLLEWVAAARGRRE